MTVTLHWWWISIICVAVPILYAIIFPAKRTGDWDFFSGLPQLIFIVIGIVAAIALCIGRWLA